MTSVMADTAEHYREQIAAALVYAAGPDGKATHTVDDILAMIAAGTAQAWFGPRSIIVTEIIDQPKRRLLHFFVAGGVMKELEQMTPLILEWGRCQGCDAASLIGRKGWHRSFLSRTGWSKSESILMEKVL